MPAPQSAVVATAVDREHVGNAGLGELLGESLVVLDEAGVGVLGAGVEADERRADAARRGLEAPDIRVGAGRAVGPGEPRSLGVPSGLVMTKYPLHDSTTLNISGWCMAIRVAP